MNIFTSFRSSLIFSLMFQLMCGLITFYTLYIPVKQESNYLYSLAGLDTVVQFIEAFFYLMLLYFGISAARASEIRYFDWFITTPMMILTAVAFFFYSSNKGREFLKSQETSREDTKLFIQSKLVKPMADFINYSNHKLSLVTILIANFLMLLTGYIGELGYMNITTATLVGFVFFFIEFYYIYKDFVVPYGDTATYLFYAIFTTVWALYGVAYVFSDKVKNISYNLLDLLSKNVYGLLLAYAIYASREVQ